ALGDVIIPYLEDVLDIQGSKRHGRIFRLLHKLKGKDIIPLAQRAAAEGSPPVASAAIAALGEDAKFEELLLVYAKDKKAEVRGAAFTALLNLDSPKGVEMLTAELGKNSISHIELAASSSKNKAVFQKVVEETENVFTDSEKNHNKIAVLLRILARSDENTALELIENKVISVLKSKGANWTVTAFELNNLFNILLERERKYLEAAYRILSVADDKYFMPYIKMRLAVKLFSAEKVFDECKDSNYYYLLYEVYGVQKGEHIPDEQKSWDRRWGKRLAEKNTFFHEFIYDSDDKAWDIFLVRVKTQVQRNTPPLINAYPHPGELYKWLCVNKHPKAEIFYKILLKLGFTESEIRECLLK
ncbi:MAG: HEAT repeat domain-containing protein, partial [Deferribacteraceae bacterium]|nr:HEAT repeat domain-containing protein [Deferribacteraceae bacterium]